jgi:hypothetical protein
MEAKYPARELTPEERAAMFQAAIAEAVVGSGTVRKKKDKHGSWNKNLWKLALSPARDTLQTSPLAHKGSCQARPPIFRRVFAA